MSNELSVIESVSASVQAAVIVGINQVMFLTLAGLVLLGIVYAVCLTAVRRH